MMAPVEVPPNVNGKRPDPQGEITVSPGSEGGQSGLPPSQGPIGPPQGPPGAPPSGPYGSRE